ncbi:MAG: fumarate reductase subunit FrdC [Enterobacteriaceae bacterium]
MTTTTKRKPYVRPMAQNWWQKLPFYRFYMLREGTSVLAVWFSLLLLYGLFALKGGPDKWLSFVELLQNPLVFIINIIALVAALLHTKTWFELAPKAVNVVVKDELMSPKPVIIALWVVTALASVIILAVAFI